MGRCIGIDLGTKRVGLALSDSLNIIASPFKTLTFIDNDDLKKRFMNCSIDDTVEVNNINNLLVNELNLKHISEVKITPIIEQITNSDYR